MTRPVPTPVHLATSLLRYPGGEVEYLAAGAGDAPRTLFLHGLAGSLADARPLASGVPGRKIFANLPGHGRSTGPDPLGYPALADAARAVADRERVTAALGVSLGAATLLRLLADTPDRFERVVLYLPAVADVPRAPGAVSVHRSLAERLAAGDEPGVTEALLLTQPSAARATPVLLEWARRRAHELIAEGGDPRRWLPLAAAVPLDGPAGLDRLAAVRVPVLVIAQEGDLAHPVAVAERLAAAFPLAELTVFGAEGALWGHRSGLRARIAPFLTPSESRRETISESPRRAASQSGGEPTGH